MICALHLRRRNNVLPVDRGRECVREKDICSLARLQSSTRRLLLRPDDGGAGVKLNRYSAC